MLRTVAPITWATPAQALWARRMTPVRRAANSRAIGPGPFRTARGAGRFLLELRLDEGFRRDWLPFDRVLDFAAAGFRFALLVRDAGGEDVRVAMVRD